MALGMVSGEKVTLFNPSPAPGAQNFRAFLENSGAVISPVPSGFAMQGKPYEGETVLPPEIPDEIFHIVVSSALFFSDSLCIVNGAGKRAPLLKPLLNLLPNIGFRNLTVSEDGEDVLLTGNGFTPPTAVSVSGAWEFEAITAAALSARKPISLRYPPIVVSHDLRLLDALGISGKELNGESGQENELARRLARVSGEKPLEERHFSWECKSSVIRIPGDVLLGSALAGAAATTQGSEVMLTQMLWETGRRGFFDALRRMKGSVEVKQKPRETTERSKPETEYSFETADIRIGWSRLEGIRVTPVQASTMNEELMILGSVAVSALGETVIHEGEAEPFSRSGDFKLLKEGLLALGAHLGDFSDGIVVKGPSPELKGDLADSGGKPEIALALAVAGMSASGTTSVFGFDEDMYPLHEFLVGIREIKECKFFTEKE